MLAGQWHVGNVSILETMEFPTITPTPQRRQSADVSWAENCSNSAMFFVAALVSKVSHPDSCYINIAAGESMCYGS